MGATQGAPSGGPTPSGAWALVRQAQRVLVGDGVGQALASGAVRSTLVAVSGAGTSFVVQIVLARAMGQAAFGAYALTLAFMNAVLLLAKLEIDNTGVRFAGAYAAQQRWGLLRGFMRDGRVATVVASLTCAGLSALAIWTFKAWLVAKHPTLAVSMWVACVLLPVTAILLVDAGFLQGFQRYFASQFAPNLLRPLLLGLMIFIWWRVGAGRVPTWGGVLSNLVASTIAATYAVYTLRRATPSAVREATIERDRPDWIRTTSPLLAVSIAQLIISQQADLIVVGTITSAREVAEYSAASQLALPLSIVVTSVTFVAQAMIADLYARGDMVSLQSLIRAVTRANAAVAAPAILVIVFGGHFLLRLYGPGYGSAYPVLLILMSAQLVIALVGALAGYLLTMTSHQNAAAWIIGGAALLNLVLTVVLTPRYGIIGTAWATLIAACARSIALAIFIRRVMGLRVPSF